MSKKVHSELNDHLQIKYLLTNYPKSDASDVGREADFS